MSDLRTEAEEKAAATIDDVFQMEDLIYTEDRFYAWEKYTFYARKEYEKDQNLKQAAASGRKAVPGLCESFSLSRVILMTSQRMQ